ncbi:MAG: AAA family ATPase [Bacteroidota bacterium]|nr:nuclease [Odoribacter sp.]MDP3643031.1 AAA family ATPase [Bacteroidota bacterium]
MERQITAKLLDWKSSATRKPLIVRGARQVGKSYSITEFGNKYFEGAIHVINFEKRIDWHSIFNLNLDVTRIVNELEINLGKRIVAGKDLLFFDEIQECPNAIASLRYFYEQMPGLHVIAAGSLLEFALGNIPFPVGRVQLMNMYPMNFSEFLLASGNEPAAQLIQEAPEILSENIHNMLIGELKKYFFVGGMPECVKTYTETQSMNDVFEIQADLLATFRQDFMKYTPRMDSGCLNSVLASIPQKIGQQIKYSNLAEGYSNPTIKKAFDLLETARLFRKVSTASPSGLPLGASASDKKFKAVMLDVGLLGCLMGSSRSIEYQKSNLLSIFQGSMAEQFVGQEILAATGNDLFYWSREAKSSNAETDYLIEKQDQVIPIEVKSGKGGSLKSLHLLLETYPNVNEAYVFSDSSFGQISAQKISFIPIYYAASAAIS